MISGEDQGFHAEPCFPIFALETGVDDPSRRACGSRYGLGHRRNQLGAVRACIAPAAPTRYWHVPPTSRRRPTSLRLVGRTPRGTSAALHTFRTKQQYSSGGLRRSPLVQGLPSAQL